MIDPQDTIAAIITAQGMGAMGAIRISGPDAFHAAQALFRSKKGTLIQDMPTYALAYGLLFEGDQLLDQALLLKMQGPSSFTGEDVAELQCHGGPLVLARVMQALVRQGVRPAKPGEFTQRAFLNGKLDLTQAESVMDLVSSSNKVMAEVAIRQMQGSLSEKIKTIKEKIIGWIASIEAEIDFPDEFPVALDPAAFKSEVLDMIHQIDHLLDTAAYGRIYREGLRIVFYGRPNVGKSSLLNGLLQQKRAIVTAEPGTTRDVIEERMLIQGIPIILMDTAGVRETGSLAEQEGVERAKRAAAEADLVLFVLDLSQGFTQEDKQLLQGLDPRKTLLIANKADLVTEPAVSFKEEATSFEVCILSALEQEGIDALIQRIRERFEAGALTAGDTAVLINRRQEDALIQVKRALASAYEGLLRGETTDLLSIDLQDAWSYLGEITGETVKEAVVSEIFARFCLGK
jgi:tRNA modification GTPase